MHHVFAHTQGPKVFCCDVDYAAYLRLLSESVKLYGWQCLAYCLMPNHVHVLVRTPEPNLGLGMWRLQSRFARDHNRRHDGKGYVWDRRYGSKRITTDAYLLTALAYIAHNPVEAHLVAGPEKWPWSSFGGVVGGRPPDWVAARLLLEHVGGPDPRGAYARLCRFAP